MHTEVQAMHRRIAELDHVEDAVAGAPARTADDPAVPLDHQPVALGE
jgi:hypothetical protein